MKVLLQRVLQASVKVEDHSVGVISKGYVLLTGIEKGDNEVVVEKMADKVYKLRLFPDENREGVFSIGDVKGEILVISQFTLCADLKKGTRPSFSKAMEPKRASVLVDVFSGALEKKGLKVEKGVFGADMKVALINDGPYTLSLELKN